MTGISVHCPYCQANFLVKLKYAGRSGGCPKCQGKIQIPDAPQAHAAPEPKPEPKPEPERQAMAPRQTANREQAAQHAPAAKLRHAIGESPLKLDPPQEVDEYAISGEVHALDAAGLSTATSSERPMLYLPRGAPNPGAKRPPYDARLQAALLAGLNVSVGAPPVKPGHIAMGIVVAAFLILLPILYVLLVLAMFACALAAFGLIGGLIIKVHSRFTVVLFALPLGLLVAAVFMIKPLFTRRRDEYAYSRRFLDPMNEPLLWTFIEQICDAVGAAHPHRVQIMVGSNAAAGHSGWFKKQYELTLGLPLFGALTTQEMAGLIAHEVGHFRQGFGDVLLRLIHYINSWFLTVIFERDEWDATVDGWAEDGGFWALMSATARGGTWLGRKVLWLLGALGVMVSRTLERQHEFDADRYWSRVAGAESFATGMRKAWYLSYADHVASQFALTCFQYGVLPDNFPRAKFAILQCLTKEQIAAADKARAEENRSLFNTHPTGAQREAMVRREGQTGAYHVRHSAAWLLRDFEPLCRASTNDAYAHFFQEHFHPHLLRPLEHFILTERPSTDATASPSQPRRPKK